MGSTLRYGGCRRWSNPAASIAASILVRGKSESEPFHDLLRRRDGRFLVRRPGMGLLATALSALLSWYFFLSPQYSFVIITLEHSLRLILFVLEGVVISALVEAMHRARRRAERALKAKSQAEDKYRSIFENAVDGIFQTSLDGRILTANPASGPHTRLQITRGADVERLRHGRQIHVDRDSRAGFVRLIQQQGMASDFENRIYRVMGA